MCGRTLDLSSYSFNNNLNRHYSSYLISIRPKYFLPVNRRRSDADFSPAFGWFWRDFNGIKKRTATFNARSKSPFGHEQQRGMLRSCVTDVYTYVEDKVHTQ